MTKRTFLIIAILAVSICVGSASAQTRRLGKICGDPNIPCRGSEGFRPWELTFAIPKNAVIYESETFYTVILKSVRLKSVDDCENAITEDERLKTQELFPKNKVFALKCSEAGDIYYTNVANEVSFLGVYAGKTLTEANAFLKTVKATGKFPGAAVRRMRAGINGT
jgi:hypothetical protein